VLFCGEGDFKDHEHVWREIVDSIRIGQETPGSSERIVDRGASVSGDHPPFVAVNATGDIVEMSQSLEVFAYRHQFYLWDPSMEPRPPIDYTEADTPGGIKTHPYVVAILTAGEFEVPLVVEIRASAPDKELKGWVRAVEGSLDIPSGRLEICECAGLAVAEFALPPGTYKVRVLSAGVGITTVESAEVRDHYRAILWPA
jgi:hypothetical protein